MGPDEGLSGVGTLVGFDRGEMSSNDTIDGGYEIEGMGNPFTRKPRPRHRLILTCHP